MINKNIDLIAFNETRLDLSIPGGLIQLDGYEVIRKIGPATEVEFVYTFATPSIRK